MTIDFKFNGESIYQRTFYLTPFLGCQIGLKEVVLALRCNMSHIICVRPKYLFFLQIMKILFSETRSSVVHIKNQFYILFFSYLDFTGIDNSWNFASKCKLMTFVSKCNKSCLFGYFVYEVVVKVCWYTPFSSIERNPFSFENLLEKFSALGGMVCFLNFL